MSPRHSDSNVGWIKREFAAIKKQMREDRAAKKLQAATIGKGGLTVKGGGDITVDDGGSLTSNYPASVGGGEATRFGPRESGYPGYGFRLLNEAGTAVIFGAERAYPSTTFPGGYTAFNVSATCSITDEAGGHGMFVSATDVTLAGGATRIEHSTTGASANCFIDPSDGRIWRSTSSRRYKQDIEDTAVDPAAVLQMRPRTWRDKGEVAKDPDTQRRYVGFIAEELDDLGLTQFVVYDHEDKPEAIAYDRLAVALLEVLKAQDARLAALEARLPEDPADA